MGLWAPPPLTRADGKSQLTQAPMELSGKTKTPLEAAPGQVWDLDLLNQWQWLTGNLFDAWLQVSGPLQQSEGPMESLS